MTIEHRLSVFASCLLCAATFLPAGALRAQMRGIACQPVPREVVAQRFRRIHTDNTERETELKTIFAEAGCPVDQLQEQMVKRKDPPNLICTLPGTTGPLIIVGAHLDHADKGSGAVDDWSGASLLPSLYQALKGSPRRHTFQFAEFTDEEKGLAGSDYYVKSLQKNQISTVRGVINLECLGLGPTEVWNHVANSELLAPLIIVAQNMGVVLQGMNVEAVGTDDTQPFRQRKVPVITIHSITQETWPILHSAKDNLTAVHLDHLYASYLLVSSYLAFLDESLK